MEAIAADYVGMLNECEKLWKLTADLIAEINRLKYVLNDIDIFWEGEANAEFHLALNEDFAVMEALCLKIKLSASLPRQAVSDYVQTEKAINALMGG